MALLEMRESIRSPHDDRSADDMLLQRYTLVCIGEIMTLKRVMFGSFYTRTQTARSENGTPSEMRAKPSHPQAATCWQNRDVTGLEDRLQALSLTPYFVVPQRKVDTHESFLDAKDSITGLRVITALQHGKEGNLTAKIPEHGVVSRVWSVTGGDASMIHVPALGLLRDGSPNTKLWTSWAGLTVSAGFYLHGPLSLWDARQAVEGRTLLWLTKMSQRDLDDNENDMITGSVNRSLWFWKLFTMTFSLARASSLARVAGTIDESIAGGEATYEAVHSWARERIHLWSRVTGVTDWDEARDTLSTIVWPDQYPGDVLGKAIWEEAVNRRDMQQGR